MKRTIVALALAVALVPLAPAVAPGAAAPARGQAPAATALDAGPGRPGARPGGRRRHGRHPVVEGRRRRRCGSSGSTRPRPATSSTTCPTRSPSAPRPRAFAQGAFAVATEVQLLRSRTLDPYGRTLGYLFLNGRNYSVLVVEARLAAETVTFYGDNGLPTEAAEVLAAAKSAGPLPFEPPHVFRGRMRERHEVDEGAGGSRPSSRPAPP